MFIATVIVVAALTILIFTLTIIAFSSLVAKESKEVELGNRDVELLNTANKKQKRSRKVIIGIGNVFGWLITLMLLFITITAITYRVSGEQFTVNNQVSLVIASESMNGFSSEKYEITLLDESELTKDDLVKLQFKAGDILTFTVMTETDTLIPYEVYGYKTNKGKIITHRFIRETDDGKLLFRGDNAGGYDTRVNRDQVILHYNGSKLTYVGFFILFSQSGFGLYSFISTMLVYILAEIYMLKYDKILNRRLEVLLANDTKSDNNTIISSTQSPVEMPTQEPVVVPVVTVPEVNKNKKKVEFTTRSGKHVEFYVTKRTQNNEKAY